MGKKPLVFVIIILLFSFWSCLTFTPRGALDFPYSFRDNVADSFRLPQTWSSRGNGLGEPTISILWGWPHDFIYGLGATLGIDFSILFRLLHLLPILVLGVWGMIGLLYYYKINKYGIIVGTLFYFLNTYLILLIDGGQLSLALAYACVPLVFLEFKKSVSGKLRDKLITTLLFFLLGVFDIRFVYLLFILIFLDFTYWLILIPIKTKKDFIISYFKTGVVNLLLFIGLSFYWILPLILSNTPALPETYQRVSQAEFLSFTRLKNAYLLFQPHWYKNVFGKLSPLDKEFILIPIIAFLAPILVFCKKFSFKEKKFQETLFWLIIACIGIFLVKGSNPPLANVYPWLFTYIPGFAIFRDSTKFYIFITLAYSILIGITTDELTEKFRWRLKIGNLKITHLPAKQGKWNIAIIPLLLTTYFLLLIRPVWLGKMTGLFSEPIYQNEFAWLSKILERDKEFSRVLSIPSRSPLSYASPTHPSVEALRLVQQRPFATGTVGTYETLNFLREAPFVGELLNIAGIKYLTYPYPDTRREELKQDNIDYYFAFLDQLANLPWIDKRISEPPVAVLQTKKTKDHFFVAPNTLYVVGSDGIYSDMIKIPDLDLSRNALIFAEEKPLILEKLDHAPISNIILYDKSETDLAASLIDKSLMIFPAQNLGFDPTKENPWYVSNVLQSNAGWWKRETMDFLWWRDFLQSKYGIDNQDFDYEGGWAISEGNNKLIINNSQFKEGNILLARVMKSSRGGKVSFYQGDKLVSEVNTKVEDPQKVEIKLTGYGDILDQISEYNKSEYFWFEAGKLINSSQNLVIETEGEINVVNALISLSEEEWNYANRITSSYKVLEWKNLSESDKKRLFQSTNDTMVSYKRISPTHYKVKIEELRLPVTLAFSETYDPLWQITETGTNNWKGSYSLYSLINGFMIEKDGDYDIYFSPQKYILSGLAISLMTLLTVIVYLQTNKFRR